MQETAVPSRRLMFGPLYAYQERIMNGPQEMRTAHRSNDWRSVAEQARHEMDPEKLIGLLQELNRILQEQRTKPQSSKLNSRAKIDSATD
jgi:hypothetical protein